MRDISCDASGLIEDVIFPTAKPRVMQAVRTFWEKATAIHVFCLQGRLRGERSARHWHDVVRLDKTGLAETAFADRLRGCHRRWFATRPWWRGSERPEKRLRAHGRRRAVVG